MTRDTIDKKDNIRMSKSIFICYETTTGLDYAKHLKKALEKIGKSAFVAVEDIKKGEPGREDIDKTITECKYFIVIVTVAAPESEEVKREIDLAQKFDKTIIPCKEKENSRSWLSKLPVISELQQIEFENKEDLARKVISEILKRETVKSAKKDQKEQQKRELEQNKKDAQKLLKRCVEKIITDWEEPIKSESLEKEMSIKRKKLHDNGIKLKEVVADYEEYLPSETVKEALDIARDMKETSKLNVRVHIVNKPADEQPDVIFKKRGDRVVERAKELIKRL